MATSEERLRILKMVEQGVISAEDAARLLEALGAGEQRRGGSYDRATTTASGRWFRVRVTDLRTGKNKVNVNIPMGLVNVGMKMGARFVPDLEAFSLSQLADMVNSGATGKLVEFEDVEDGERVEIFVD